MEFLLFRGRIRCLPFWAWWLGSWLLVGALTIGGIALGESAGLAGLIVSVAVATYIQVTAFLARLRDTGRDPWQIFMLVIPLFGVIYFIMVGVDPSKSDS